MAAPTIRVGNDANYREPGYRGGVTIGYADQRIKEPLQQIKEIPDTDDPKTENIPGATPNHPLESFSGRMTTSN